MSGIEPSQAGVPPRQPVSILVGDRFDDFARNPGVLTFSTFQATWPCADVPVPSIAIGQGLSSEAIDAVSGLTRHHGPTALRPPHANGRLTHKQVPENIMISEPRRLDATRFAVDLQLDDRSEVLADHQTGQHIQGLALIEAARQTWTAVAERYLVAGDRPTRFVLDAVASRFSSFVFPLPAILTLELVETQPTALQTVYGVRVVVEQCGQLSATIEATFRVIDQRIGERQETIAARRALESFLATDAPRAEPPAKAMPEGSAPTGERPGHGEAQPA